MNRLAITADDFGLSEPVNAAVEEAHRRGILSAASLMVGGPAAADAIKRARALPNLRVGLHVVLVNDDPISPSAQIPALVDGGRTLAQRSRRLQRPQRRCACRAAANERRNHRAIRSVSRDRIAARSRQHASAFSFKSDRCRCYCQHRAALRHARAARSRRIRGGSSPTSIRKRTALPPASSRRGPRCFAGRSDAPD